MAEALPDGSGKPGEDTPPAALALAAVKSFCAGLAANSRNKC